MTLLASPISRRALLFLTGAGPALFIIAPTAAWGDNRQIVSTVANAALAIARAGGSPAAFRRLLTR
jgi:hypothetical protein